MKCSRLSFAYKILEAAAAMETSHGRRNQMLDTGGTKDFRDLNERQELGPRGETAWV